jgi:hypothetical protein
MQTASVSQAPRRFAVPVMVPRLSACTEPPPLPFRVWGGIGGKGVDVMLSILRIKNGSIHDSDHSTNLEWLPPLPSRYGVIDVMANSANSEPPPLPFRVWGGIGGKGVDVEHSSN